MTLSIGEAGGIGRNPGNPAVSDLETAPDVLSIRTADEIFAGLTKLNGLPRGVSEDLNEAFMEGERIALESFLVPAPGWPVLADEVKLGDLRKKCNDLKKLQRNGHLFGATATQGNLAGLRWGFKETEHLRERYGGGTFRIVEL